MSGNQDRTVSKRVVNLNEINLDKLAIDLASGHEFNVTKTTTETYKFTKSGSKSKSKEVKVVVNRQHSSPPTASSSRAISSQAEPRKPPSPPRNRNNLFERLIAQFGDRASQSPSAGGYNAWRALVSEVEYMQNKDIYINDLEGRQASQLFVELDGVLHEAEFGSDVGKDWESLRRGASNRASTETLKEIRRQFLESWGETVRKWRVRVQERADRSWNEYLKSKEKEKEKVRAQEVLKELGRQKQKREEKEKVRAQEALKELGRQKQNQEEKDKAKEFNILGWVF